MVLWIGLAVMSAAVVAALLSPLLRRGEPDDRVPAGDATLIYRDQLREIDREHAGGQLGEAEYRAARAEIARRLFAAEAARASPASHASRSSARAVAGVLAIGIPTAAIALYLLYGSPGLPAQPFAARLKAPIATARVDELIRAVEARLREHPEDGQGWDVIAPVYLKQGRFRDAADAFSRAARLLGDSAKRLAGFAEATVLENDGIVTEPARLAYEKVARLEPARPEPRFWLALAKEQDGALAAALADYDALIKSAGEDAPWVGLVIERRDAVRKRLAGTPGAAKDAARNTPGPSAADIAAADKLSPEDRQRMIEGMVSGLAERLRRDGRDLAGWQRLIRAYAAMGRKTEAIAALGDARRNFQGEAPSLQTLGDLARSLGLES